MIRPRVFLSHAKEDGALVGRLAEDLRAAQLEVWFDEWELLPGDSLRRRIFAHGIASCDLFFIYLSEASLSSSWCKHELDAALIASLEDRGCSVSLFLSTEAIRGQLPIDIRGLYAPVLQESLYPRALAQLVSSCWTAVQARHRLVDPRGRVLCGTNIAETPYRRASFVGDAQDRLVLVGPNLRSWLSADEDKALLVGAMERGTAVTFIMATPELLRSFGDEGEIHLKASTADLLEIRGRLSADAHEKFAAHFHRGASTLSAAFRDPDHDTGLVVVGPRWAIDYQPQRRMFFVVEKLQNPEVFSALHSSTFLMIQADAASLDEMAASMDLL